MLNYKIISKKNWSGINEELKAIREDVSDATAFVKQIELGNLDASISNNGASIELIQSLSAMRDQMKTFSVEDAERRWTTEGLAKFVEVLRAKNNNLEALSDDIIRGLVQYLKANQGGLYLVNDDDPKDVFIELHACYAYDRKKHLHQRIELGQGLIGQAVLEKGKIYMTDIPKDYVKITSGLGEALPRTILIAPLKLNDSVFGVLELASFDEFKDYEIDFIEKIGESIASTISSMKVGERTAKLLLETQQQTEEMRAQEEEMRQNMEELSATQEGMKRIMKEVETKEAYMSSLLNVTSDMIFSVDKNYKLVTWNKAMATSLEGFGIRLEKGANTMDWNAESEKEKQRGLYTRAFAGETIEFTSPTVQNEKTYHFLSIYAPLRDEHGIVSEVAVFAKDVTAMIDAQQKAEALLHDAQHQSEELRAQEEELRQNMEELSATQEGMKRIMKEVEMKEAYMSSLLNVTSDMIFTVDKNYKLITWNQAMAKSLEVFGMRLEKGANTMDWNAESEKEKQLDLYTRAFAGEMVEFTSPSVINGETYHFLSIYAPLRDEHGNVYEVAVFAKDVTDITIAKMKVEASMRAVKNLIDVSGDSIMTLDRNFKVVLFNETYRASFANQGLEIKEGFDVLTFFAKNEVQEKKKLFERIFNGETVELNDHLTGSGLDLHFSVKHAPMVNDQGKVETIAVFARDITELTKGRLQTEAMLSQSQQQTEELRAQEEELRQNMEEIHAQQEDMRSQLNQIAGLKEDLEAREMVFGFTTILSEADLNGTITFLNEKFCQVSGYTQEELIGRPHNTLRHPDMPKDLFKKMWNTIKKGETFKGIIKNKAKDGSHYWVDATIVPVKDQDGKIIKYIGARYHITNDDMAEILYKEQFQKSKLVHLN